MISWRHPHSSWGFSWSLLFTFLVPFLSLLSDVQAYTLQASTSPSNNTNDLTQIGSLRFFLNSSQLQIDTPIRLAPLTQALATLSQNTFSSYNLLGQLVDVDPNNSIVVNKTEIALISCDPSSYPGVLGAGTTIANVLESPVDPAAILLYSAQSDHCNYTVNDPNSTYPSVFTVLGADAAGLIVNQLSTYSNASFSQIGPDMSTASNGTLPTPGVSNPNNSSQTGSGSLAASPTTAVAMIILYSITGIITALFLGIIITGAVRAHRHPERYGPRNVVGRPRQSRARGMARAVLETIPIVKFGDSNNQVDAVKGDVEMASGHEVDGTVGAEERPTSDGNENETAHSSELPSDNNPDHAGTETPPAQEATGARSHEDANEPGNHVCPICTDDFVKGQDVRVLPCNHQFHPECIDPWLINVSGTCPLCRIDLNAAETVVEEEEDEGERDDAERHDEPDSSIETSQARNSTIQHRALSSYFPDVRRMRNASVEERLAALRRLRQSSEQDRTIADETAEERVEETVEEHQNRRRSMTARLRERFRIRTRPHDDHDQLPPLPPSS